MSSELVDNRKLICEMICSFDHAVRIMKGLKVKRHAKLGFSYELDDLGMSVWDAKIDKQFKYLTEAANRSKWTRHFDNVPRAGSYRGDAEAIHLKVYRETSTRG